MPSVFLAKLSHVNVSLNGQRILHDVSFALQAGQCWLVAGANGAGKSTFLKLLRGEIWPEVGGGSRLYALVNDQARESPIGVRERMALVSPEQQDRLLRLELPLTGLELVQSGFQQADFVSEPLAAAQFERVDKLIAQMDLDFLRERPMLEMSKGQLRRVLLARALFAKPRVLVLDECFSGIDPESRHGLMQVVNQAVNAGLTVLYTTHRTEERLASTSHLIGFQHGQVVRSGAFVTEAKSSAAGEGRVVKSHPPSKRARQPLLEVQHANVHLGDPRDDATAADGAGRPNKHHVLHDINWRVLPGEQWALVGHNGAGKSTLAKLVLGEVTAALGARIKRFGRERMPIWERQARIGLISSEVQVRHRVHVPGWVIVASGLTASVGWARELEPAERERLEQLLAALQIEDLHERMADQVSHGQLKKLLIARSMISRPEIVILDEPFDYLDAASRERLLALIERETSRTQFITVAHRLEDLPASVTHALWLEQGRVRFSGRWAKFLALRPDFSNLTVSD